jgi:hypothetical protein
VIFVNAPKPVLEDLRQILANADKIVVRRVQGHGQRPSSSQLKSAPTLHPQPLFPNPNVRDANKIHYSFFFAAHGLRAKVNVNNLQYSVSHFCFWKMIAAHSFESLMARSLSY